MIKKSLMILAVSSVVMVPSLATTAQGATLGEQIWVMLGSLIPPGWIMIQSEGTRNLIRYIG
ncbi:hypothetical protein [Brevibacillus brevis]|uniref:Uncharacterized protein n=1 Tax=Brevibacillus brevis TaxID=1393 RepID=A0A517I4E8_BREBE|nr:hypothetical protein [Brevibacillus brevis]QDS33775.1 hypothetical protein FPS98_07100 [Brevibacillus brevis]